MERPRISLVDVMIFVVVLATVLVMIFGLPSGS